jgi:CRP/FNR family transcriptional regulator, cyclic AMP receptor protein
MSVPHDPAFDSSTFLNGPGPGKTLVRLRAKQLFFVQGAAADCIFYLQTGRAKLTVVSQRGKEATLTLPSSGDFLGEESIAQTPGSRTATATAMTECIAVRIRREEMIRRMHEDQPFCDLFMAFLLARGMRAQADLVDQLFNSSEQRLARILLLMANFGKTDEPERLVPKITQETLAEMVGTTRSRVSFFMNRFRQRGFLRYNGATIRVHRTLLSVILEDQPDSQDAASALLGTSPLGEGPCYERQEFGRVGAKRQGRPGVPIPSRPRERLALSL